MLSFNFTLWDKTSSVLRNYPTLYRGESLTVTAHVQKYRTKAN